MCGIAGIYNWESSRPVDQGILRDMAHRMAHRGPDGDGIYANGPVGLAHRRLSIIDINSGSQPMASPSGRQHLSYNGEIYNYLELRLELKRLGYRFRTHSDTEVVLASYLQWGEAFVERLNGMFAFAIWDQQSRRLTLGRDRLGIKPLFWVKTPGGMAFASEIKVLRAIPDCAREINIDAIDEYMTCGYVTAPRCMVNGVHKLPPASLMSVDQRGVRDHRYWQFRFLPDYEVTEDAWQEQIRETFQDALKLQLRSDVPLGVFLSGGVDSTIICSEMTRQIEKKTEINSFCVGVESPDSQTEFDWAARVANKLGLNHHEYCLSSKQHGEFLIEAAMAIGEPIVEPMIGQLLAVSKFAAEHVKVVLSGEGADEFWLGYPGYRTLGLMDRFYRMVPALFIPGVKSSLLKLADSRLTSGRPAKYLRLLAEPLERRYLGLNFFDTANKLSVYSGDLKEHFATTDAREYARRYYSDVGGSESVSRMAAVDGQAWLVDNTLLRSDHMTMAASLELRVPFLDHRLVDLACRIPVAKKIRGSDQKRILKNAFYADVSQGVATRRKLGFPTPLNRLFREPWGEQVRDVILGSQENARNLFNRQRLGEMYQEHRAEKRDWGRELLQVLLFEYWASSLSSETKPQSSEQTLTSVV